MKKSDRLRTFESNYGRAFGWFVERDGTTVAALVEPQHEDMFWCSYRVEPAEGGPLPEIIFTPEFWHADDLTFTNRETGEVAPRAFAGSMTPTAERPRVLMRALYSRLRPTLRERIVLWYRRVGRAGEKPG